MVYVSTVSIVYNLRMDHYGVRKYRNIENQKYEIEYVFLTPLRNVLTNFRVQRSILAVGMPIQINPPQKPGSDPLTVAAKLLISVVVAQHGRKVEKTVKNLQQLSQRWVNQKNQEPTMKTQTVP